MAAGAREEFQGETFHNQRCDWIACSEFREEAGSKPQQGSCLKDSRAVEYRRQLAGTQSSLGALLLSAGRPLGAVGAVGLDFLSDHAADISFPPAPLLRWASMLGRAAFHLGRAGANGCPHSSGRTRRGRS